MQHIGGATVTDSFLAMIVSLLATVSTVYGILAIQRLRAEETAGGAEPLLATRLSRRGWVARYLFMAAGGGVVVLLSGAVGLGVTAAVTTGDVGIVGKVLAAALSYSPAMWISVGLAIVLFSFAPRALGLAWIVLGYAITLTMLGALLQLPRWMDNLSPFGHIPDLPAGDFTVVPLVALTAITAGLIWIGVTAFQRRDISAA
jgi:ABC-2 type transport system permease protein